MDSLNILESLTEFREIKNIERIKLMRIIEDVFRHVIIKKYGSDENFNIIVNVDRGDIEVWRNRIIVEDGKVEDPTKQIAYSEAIRIEPDFEIGEEASEQITSNEFNRREILTFLQNLKTKVLEFEKDNIYKKYKDNVGEIISGEVYQIDNKKIILLDDEGIELILPKSEQIPSDKFRKNDTIRAVVLKVDINKKNNNPEIILSRTSPVFLERLFESEVPEIFDGLITIKKVVRVPGERAKIAVESYDSRIDPVGACVGMKGSRIHSIVRELNNENIDVINYTTNTSLYITRSLSPAKITSITLDEENKKAQVFLKPDQVSLAIGKSGHNIKLASKLIGYDIDVYNDMEDDVDDVDLQEFADEIDQWIIDIFKEKGYDTAKSILALDFETLVKRTDLEEETIQEIINILKAEFE